MNDVKPVSIGLIINPYAGLGGEAALKGSDGDDIRQQALSYHHDQLRSPQRATRFAQALNQLLQVQGGASCQWHCLPNLLGENVLRESGFDPHIISYAPINRVDDTRFAINEFLNLNVDLIVFVGGDGTARDVLDVIADQSPDSASTLCLGVPAGVKMQSGVFAITPEAAANIIAQWLQGELNTVAEQDVRDIDENALRNNTVRSRYYGGMNTLSSPQFLQRLKQSGVEHDELVLDEIADQLDELLDEGYTLLLGPGSTTAHFMQRQSFTNTLVGFDAVNNNGVIANNLNGRQCLALLQGSPQFKLILSPTGQQGFLLGRGNQQLTSEFLFAVRKEQMIIASTKKKLLELQGQSLRLDTNNTQLNQHLSGFYSVLTAYQETVIYPVGNG